MELDQYNGYIISIVGADGLVLQGISSHSTEYVLVHFQLFMG